jgi:hypothetical protein
MNQTRLAYILGDTPGRVLVRLIFLSFVVGVIMASLGIDPSDIVSSLRDFGETIWNMGFSTVERALRYFLLGAAVVIPIWIVLRILKIGGRRA